MRSPSIDGAMLSAERCRALLSQHTFGRVGLSIDALPVVLPVHYRFDGERLVIRAEPGRKLCVALRGAVVCFEIDGPGDATSSGWCVLVTGVAEQLASAARSFAIGIDRITGLGLSGGPGASEGHGPTDGCALTVGA